MEKLGCKTSSRGKLDTKRLPFWICNILEVNNETFMLQWYDAAKVGIFIHFGVYAVPGFRSEWFWCFWQCPDRVQSDVVDFMKKNYRPGFTYQDFASDFKFVVDHLYYVWTTV